MPTLVEKPFITVDGNLSDWTSADLVSNPANAVPGYLLYGAVQDNTYIIGINATETTDPLIGAGSTIWLNTDQNTGTGYNFSWASIGADYEIQFDSTDTPYLYNYNTTTQSWTQVSPTPLTYAFSADGESLEIAIPRSLLTPTGGTAPADINIAAQITTPATSATASTTTYFPSYYAAQPEYTITDPATLPTPTETHKVAIVYSDASANLYFSKTAYDDLFMAAQNQARMAGVQFDVIDESQLTSINNLIGYDALIFPAMPDVNTTNLASIMSALESAVNDYHISIITSGNFLTNDQTGAALPGNPYANMETLLGLEPTTSYGNGAAVTVTANDVSSPIMRSYTPGQTIQTYSNESFASYQGVGGVTPDVLVNQNVTPAGATTSTTLPGVVETTTGGTNVHFATADLMGDSNLLSNVIQSVVLGTQPGVALHISRDAGVVAARMDMDQSQFPADVSPASGQGIYSTLIPILQQWNQQYGFVGSFYINIGDNPTGTATGANGSEVTSTNWATSLPYYQAILATGSEIGNHSDTHLINPPTQTFTATTAGDTPAGSTTITLNSVPSFGGSTVGMWVTDASNPGALGSNTPLSGAAGEGGAVANTQITAVNGNTISISYVPAGYGGINDGTLADIPAGTTLTFTIPAENTNFLQTTGTVLSADGNPFTYAYEFGTSKTTEEQQLGTTIYGAAVPGANETATTDQNIMQYYQSGSGYTGYVTGGWTGVGSGYPSAIGYLDPTDQGSLYIAPNMTFDFTEIQYEGKTLAQAEADWASQFQSLTANAAGTPIVVWPIHDYGAAAWNTTSDTGTGSPYSTAMYTNFIQQAYSDNYEFVTLEELAARIQAQQKATINYTTSGNTVTATVTPDPSAPDLGAMALDVINGGTEVIQNVTNWYAYNTTELFLPKNGGTFTINLGATQDDMTHIDSLPMRADLMSVSGDGLNLSFSLVGDGLVDIDLGPCGTMTPIVTGATVASLANGHLDLSLTGLGEHDVTVCVLPSITAMAFSADSGASATDFITNVAAQTITGTLNAALPTGDVVQVSLDNGTTWLAATVGAGGSSFTLAGANLTGSNTLLARVQSATGMTGPVFSQAYVLDQIPPAAPSAPVMTVASDSGTSHSDDITNVTTPTFTGIAEAGSTVTLLDGTTVIGTGSATTATWTITASTLAAGAHGIRAEAIDAAGNISALSAALAVVIDTSAAAPTALALAPASDSGLSNADDITNVSKPTFVGGGEAGATVTLYDGTTMIGTGVVTAAGTFSIASTATLANGKHSITAKEVDFAGNVSAASAALPVTVDTVAPAAPTNLALAAASDTGVSNRDDITNVTTPTFTGNAEAGSTVKLYDGSALLGTTTAASNGTWSLASGKLADGVHTITATATDVAGNVGGASAKLWVTIDTAPPSAPVFTALNASSLLTIFSGTAEAGSMVSILSGTTSLGTTTASSSGSWSWMFLGTSSSVRVLTATTSDKAGNKSGSSGSVQLGTGHADQFAATAGNNLFYGGGGADTFTFAGLSGHDIIQDFAVSGTSHDVIDFHGISTLNNFTNVMSHATQVGSGTVITLDSNNNLTLANVTRSTLTASDFTFV